MEIKDTVVGLCGQAQDAGRRGEWEAANIYLRRAQELAQAQGNGLLHRASVSFTDAHLCYLSGKFEEGHKRWTTLLYGDIGRALTDVSRSNFATTMAHTATAAGQFEIALSHYREAQAYAEGVLRSGVGGDNRLLDLWAKANQAQVLARMGKQAEAEKLLAEATAEAKAREGNGSTRLVSFLDKMQEIRQNTPAAPAVKSSVKDGAPVADTVVDDRDESIEDILAELDAMIGLRRVKEEVRSLAAFLQIQKAREDAGLKTVRTAQHLVFAGPPGTGKLLPLDTPIPTPSGWTTMGEIEPGDRVLGRDGLPTTVVFVSDVEDEPILYDITFSDGRVITACADHQWTVINSHDDDTERVMTTRQMLSARAPLAVRCTAPLLPAGSAPPDPIDAVVQEVASFTDPRGRLPVGWLRCDHHSRSELMQALIRAFGRGTGPGCCEIRLPLHAPKLIEDIEELAITLGALTRLDRDDHELIMRAEFPRSFPVPGQSRSEIARALRPRHLRREIISISPAPSRPGKCIQVDNEDHVYLCGRGMIPTHNTTVARLMGRIYKALGMLPEARLTEAQRADLVAGYVGQTAEKTKAVIEQAIPGCLVIDEAYSITEGGDNDFGREALTTILKMMEDHRDELVVIVTGYSAEMEKFIASNPGLRSRFTTTIHFEDYSVDELMNIATVMGTAADYGFTPTAREALKELIERERVIAGKDWGNGRSVRNIFEDLLEAQASRLVSGMSRKSPTKTQLSQITKADVQTLATRIESDRQQGQAQLQKLTPRTG